MVAQWLRAAAGDPAARPAALRYAACISIVQVGWVVRLFLPQPAALWVFYVLGVGEMLVPSCAERAAHGGGTPWHPGHIAERYGLFTLIVLGECIAAVTVALHSREPGRTASRPGWWRSVAGAVLLVFARLVVVLREPGRGGPAPVVASWPSSGATATTSSSGPSVRWAPGCSWRRRPRTARLRRRRRPRRGWRWPCRSLRISS